MSAPYDCSKGHIWIRYGSQPCPLCSSHQASRELERRLDRLASVIIYSATLLETEESSPAREAERLRGALNAAATYEGGNFNKFLDELFTPKNAYPSGFNIGDIVTMKRGTQRKYNAFIVFSEGETAKVIKPPNENFPDDAVQVSYRNGWRAVDADCLELVKKEPGPGKYAGQPGYAAAGWNPDVDF